MMETERSPLLTTSTHRLPSKKDLVWILVGLWTPVFLGSLDGTIVATLLAPIGSYFEKANQSSYLGTSYLLSVAACTPLYGRLSDILGRKGLYFYYCLTQSSQFPLGAMLLGLSLFSMYITNVPVFVHNRSQRHGHPLVRHCYQNGIPHRCEGFGRSVLAEPFRPCSHVLLGMGGGG
jgi:hypothetical protein